MGMGLLPNETDRYPSQEAGKPANMVSVAVGNYDQIETADSIRTEPPEQKRLVGTAIDKGVVAIATRNQNGISLANVQHRDGTRPRIASRDQHEHECQYRGDDGEIFG
jgi:hypothetical protein